jgi:hypothetical protein
MVEENLPASVGPRSEAASFERLKSVNEHGAEYWSARDLQSALGYSHWRGFEKAIAKAITSCQQSGNDPDHHFARAKWSPWGPAANAKLSISTSRASPAT